MGNERRRSWRSLILRELGYKELFQLIDFAKLWNAPENQAIAKVSPRAYRFDTKLPTGHGNIVTLYGDWSLISSHLPLDENRIRRMTIITSSVLAVEVSKSLAVPWFSPQDVPISDINPPNNVLEFRTGGTYVASLETPIVIEPKTSASQLRNLCEVPRQ